MPMVECMDRGIGRIIEQLRAASDSITIIMFLRDNGACAEDKAGRQRKTANKLRPFGPDNLQPQVWPPMQTRDGRSVRSGQRVPGRGYGVWPRLGQCQQPPL